MLIIAGYFSYQGLGSDLLPEMDEGAFVLDYFTPAGTSLTETNRILEHVDQILRRIPEVSITSRRTGLQLGLAAVTEANNGDFTVRLKRTVRVPSMRSRPMHVNRSMRPSHRWIWSSSRFCRI